MALCILHIEDNPNDRLLIARELLKTFPAMQIQEIRDQTELDQALEDDGFDAVITDYQLRWTNGLKVLHTVKARFPDCPIIMFTNTGSEEIAVEAMKSGLDDYLLKRPAVYPRVPLALSAAMERAETRRRVQAYEIELERMNAQLKRAMMETHHRVKNNLQTIIALLDIQMMEHEEQQAVSFEQLQHIAQHISALANVHEMLTRNALTDTEITSISAQAELASLLPTFQSIAGGRRLYLSAEDARLPIEYSAPFAFVTNELILNAIKHGKGDIEIILAVQDGRVVLVVSDHGAGFPPGFDPYSGGKTGLMLVNSLSRSDLGGNVVYENPGTGGARVTVTFSLPRLEK